MTTPDQWLVFGLFGLFACLVLLGAAFAGAGYFGELPDPVTDRFVPELPERPLTPGDLAFAHFATTAWGYSKEQVDRLLAHAAKQWDADRSDAADDVGADASRGSAAGAGLARRAISARP